MSKQTKKEKKNITKRDERIREQVTRKKKKKGEKK
jgi:hypothetical protein